MDADVAAQVVADVFEQGSGVPGALRRLGAQVAVEPLPAGDYRISGAVLVERKTVADLHGSLARGRLWAQVGSIRDTAVTPFLLVEGEDLDRGPRHPNAIRGALLGIADLGVAILRSRDPADSALWIHRLAVRQARKARARARPERTGNSPPPGLAVLAAVPGISDATARALLERFGSVEGVLHAGPERWAEVTGIGSVRAHALTEALLRQRRGNGPSALGSRRDRPRWSSCFAFTSLRWGKGMSVISRKNQVTLPIEALRAAGLRPGDDVRVHAIGPGHLELVRAEELVAEFAGIFDSTAYPPDYLTELRRD